MNKMVKIICVVIFIICICVITCIFDYRKNSKIKSNEIKNKLNNNCEPLSGGGFVINFDSNDGNQIDSMHVCIACSPDSYEDLPVPVKDGYVFDGWFYDKDFTKKVSGDSSLDVKPVYSLDKNDCMIGYKDINLFAKWK